MQNGGLTFLRDTIIVLGLPPPSPQIYPCEPLRKGVLCTEIISRQPSREIHSFVERYVMMVCEKRTRNLLISPLLREKNSKNLHIATYRSGQCLPEKQTVLFSWLSELQICNSIIYFKIPNNIFVLQEKDCLSKRNAN